MNTMSLLLPVLALALGMAACPADKPDVQTQTGASFDGQTLYDMGYALKHITPVTAELNALTLQALRAAADLGNAEAMVQLGEMYMAGRLRPRRQQGASLRRP
ncbi:MAG: hypothetical protein OEQ18_10615 [Gammaproteobacteria bacterium]|nr:hypothetical protein [Gammaproteobacteria bacterium]